MGKYAIDDTTLSGLASAVRHVTKSSASMTPAEMAEALNNYEPPSGGGGKPEKQINFIDYDGTIVASYTAEEWASVTALPANPSHDGLTAQGWNWTKAQIDAQLVALPDGKVWAGQMYITDDEKTRIYIRLEDGRLHPYLGICPNGTVVVDWGDNSDTSTLTGTSLETVVYADHEYATGGDYMITLTVSNGSFAFFGDSNTSYILNKDTTHSANENKVYTNAVQKIELGTGAGIGTYAFNYCHSLASVMIPTGVTSIGDYVFNYCSSLASVTIPTGVTSIGTYAFSYCSSLASVTIPTGVTSIGDYVFNYCSSLASVTIPTGVTSIGKYAFGSCYSLASVMIPAEVTSISNYAFNYCYSLASVTIPTGVTSIGTYAFNNCSSLASLTIPAEVTSIGNQAFYNCYGMAEYHFLSETPPTLGGTSVFTNIRSDCKIYVPEASLDAYKTASRWSTHASKMVGE